MPRRVTPRSEPGRLPVGRRSALVDSGHVRTPRTWTWNRGRSHRWAWNPGPGRGGTGPDLVGAPLRTGRGSRGIAGARRLRQVSVRPGVPGTERRPRARVVHASGRPVATRVPGRPRVGEHPRGHRPPGTGRPADPPAGGPLRHRRRRPVLGHRRAGGRHRIRGRCGAGDRPGSRRSLPPEGGPRQAPPAGARDRHPLRDRSRPHPGRRAGRSPDRLCRRAVHRGQLSGGGRSVQRISPGSKRSCTATPRSGTGSSAASPTWLWPRSAPNSTPGPRPCRCSTAGPAFWLPVTTRNSSCPPPVGSSKSWRHPTPGRPPSSSASVPANCSL